MNILLGYDDACEKNYNLLLSLNKSKFNKFYSNYEKKHRISIATSGLKYFVYHNLNINNENNYNEEEYNNFLESSYSVNKILETYNQDVYNVIKDIFQGSNQYWVENNFKQGLQENDSSVDFPMNNAIGLQDTAKNFSENELTKTIQSYFQNKDRIQKAITIKIFCNFLSILPFIVGPELCTGCANNFKNRISIIDRLKDGDLTFKKINKIKQDIVVAVSFFMRLDINTINLKNIKQKQDYFFRSIVTQYIYNNIKDNNNCSYDEIEDNIIFHHNDYNESLKIDIEYDNKVTIDDKIFILQKFFLEPLSQKQEFRSFALSVMLLFHDKALIDNLTRKLLTISRCFNCNKKNDPYEEVLSEISHKISIIERGEGINFLKESQDIKNKIVFQEQIEKPSSMIQKPYQNHQKNSQIIKK